MAKKRLVCTLLSGGLDSGLLLLRLVSERMRPVPVYLKCGFQWEETELYWLRRFLKAMRSHAVAPLTTLELPLASVYGAHWSVTGRQIPEADSPDVAVYLPGRNVLLLTAAAILCVQRKISTIALGLLKGNPFGDATTRFFRQLERCLSQALQHPLSIQTPLRRCSKSSLIRSTVQRSTAAGGNGGKFPLELTFSCLRPHGRRHCGRCHKCAERSRAFHAAGVPDPTTYVHPWHGI
jgi:7-cyano-7-deazaguanine synthase